ncbi:MAG: hypothetical protein ACKOPH_04825 [Methylocystis sp.]
MKFICYLSRPALVASFLIFYNLSSSLSDEATILKSSQDIKYTSSGKGVETSILYGDPSKPG